MTVLNLWGSQSNGTTDSERLLQNLRDYADAAHSLLWQRQAIFAAAALLTAFYLDPIKAVLFYAALLICEAQDLSIARRITRLSGDDRRAITQCYAWVLVNTVISSLVISGYVISVSVMQGSGGQFTPLFFLFAIALFAAMNNHQIVWALVLRMTIYGVAFLAIAGKGIWLYRPPLDSALWLQLFTVLFVLFFLIDCSITFLGLYRRNLNQLEELKAEHDRTKAALVVKSRFVSIVSHELRTPLTSIKGSLELLNSGKAGSVPPAATPLVEMASKNSRRLAELIDDLLDLQRIEAGEMKFRMVKVHVQALIADAIAAHQGLAEKFKVTLREDTMESRPLYVLADESRLMQVLSNVISNAAKFSFDGGDVLVGCTLSEGRVRIHVRDHGVGIPEGMKEKVFERFTQLDSSDQRRAGGTGLGMNISREIMEAFGGTIDYESEFGKGTTFFMELAACEPTASSAAPEAARVVPLPLVANG
jgi:signal transduction histidine kinase